MNAEELAIALADKSMASGNYESIPPNRILYVKTRYVYAGKGLPISRGVTQGRRILPRTFTGPSRI